MFALKIKAYAESANHDGRIAAVYLFAGNVLLDLLFARSGNLLDTVVRKRENGYKLGRVINKGKTIILAKQLFALQKCVFCEEIVQVVVPALE